jgi:hypothetical protein
VLLKRSYDIVPDRPCRRAADDNEIVAADEFWDAPLNSSVRHESDLVAFKLGTDVVLNGRVHAPGGKPAQSCRAALHVGGRSKELFVIGDRVARFRNGALPTFTDPKPFQTMDLRYERAYGGIDVYSDPVAVYAYPNNPLGCGFAVANSSASIESLPLPNLEDPADPLTPERLCIGAYANWTHQPFPAGLGWYPSAWIARTKYAGIMPGDRDAETQRRRAYTRTVRPEQRQAFLNQQLPTMDFSYFQGASRGLAMPHLSPGEEVWAENLSPEGRLHFWLPAETPRIGLDIGSGVQQGPGVIHTVMIHMDERRVDIVWRRSFPYRGLAWLPQTDKMEVHVQ